MVCIYCSGQLAVSNSRKNKRSTSVWRRRKCIDCGAVFTSEESLRLESALTITENKLHTAFVREKLWLSVYEAVKHRKTAISDANGLTDTIITRLIPQIHDASLSKTDIAAAAHGVLRRFDRFSADSYAAYH